MYSFAIRIYTTAKKRKGAAESSVCSSGILPEIGGGGGNLRQDAEATFSAT
jgi:hypothetical protein